MPDSTLAAVLEDNAHAIARLGEQIRSPRGVIPFIGAGVSVPYRCPGWPAFLRQLGDRLALRKPVDALLARQDFEGAADLLAEAHGPSGFQVDVERSFGHHVGAGLEPSGVLALVPKLSVGPVVTTNFDFLIERAFEAAGRPIEVLNGLAVDSAANRLTLGKPFLLKIHGSADERGGRVFTGRDYDQHYGPRRRGRPGARAPLGGLLFRVMACGTPLLFIGSSLIKDRTLDVLQRAHRDASHLLTHYAFVQRDVDGRALAQRLEFLASLGIEPIWYPPGQHGLIDAVLRHLLLAASPHRPSTRPQTEGEARSEGRINALARFVVGRDAELEALDDRLAADSRRALVVTGEAGAGKSALLACWLTRRRDAGDAVAAHFFSRSDGITDAAEACTSLVGQIRRLAGRTSVPEEQRPGSSREALYRELSAWAGAQAKPLIVVLDALDEAQDMRRPGPATLPDHVVLVASARAAAGEAPTELAGDWLPGADRSELGALQRESVAAWLAGSRVPALRALAADAGALNTIMARSAGNALYLEHLIEDLARAAARSASWQDMLERVPSGLEAYAEQQLHALLKDRRHGVRAKKVLALLCTLRGPLPDADMQALVGASLLDLPWTVTRWIASVRDEQRRLQHRFGHERLALAFAPPLADACDTARRALLIHCRRWTNHRSAYAIRHLTEHLEDAGDISALCELARDEAFCEAQRLAFPDEPELTLQAAESALRLAMRTGDTPIAAAMLLASASRAVRLAALQSPLDALRAGRLDRAVRLAELQGSEHRVLWLALLAGELLDAGRAQDARRLLQSLAAGTLPRLREWQSDAALLLLFEVRELDPQAFERAIEGLLGRDSERTLVNEPRPWAVCRLMIERGQLDAAQRQGRRWHATLAQPLAIAYARTGRLDDALQQVKAVKLKFTSQLLIRIGEACLANGDSQPLPALIEMALRHLPEDNAPYRRNLMRQAAALASAARGEASLLEDLSPAEAAWALASAAGLAGAGGPAAAALAEQAHVLCEAVESPPLRVRTMARVARECANVDSKRSRLLVTRAEALARTLTATDWKRDGSALLDDPPWTELAHAAAACGDFDAVPRLLASLDAHNEWAAAIVLERVAAQRVASIGLHDALRWLHDQATPQQRSPKSWPQLCLPALQTAFAQRRCAPARESLATLLGAMAPQGRQELEHTLIGIVDALNEADRSSDAEPVAASIGNGFDRQWAWMRIGLAHARHARLDDAQAALDRIEPAEPSLHDPVLAAIADVQMARGDVDAATGTIGRMNWRSEPAASAKARLAVGLAHRDGLSAACHHLVALETPEAAARVLGDLAAAVGDSASPAQVFDPLITHIDRNGPTALVRTIGFASLGRGLARRGHHDMALLAFARAAQQAAAAQDDARRQESNQPAAPSRPWRELAAEALRAGLHDVAAPALRNMAAAETYMHHADDNLAELAKAVLLDASTAIALELTARIEDVGTATRMLDAIGAAGALPEGYLEQVQQLWAGRPDRDTWLVWYARQLARCGATQPLAELLVDRPRDLVTAFGLCVALAALKPEMAAGVAAAVQAAAPGHGSPVTPAAPASPARPRTAPAAPAAGSRSR